MQTTTRHPHIETFERWLRALESGATGASLALFFTPDAVAVEHPNLLFPAGNRRDLPALLAAAERGRNAVDAQRFEVREVLVQDDRLVARVRWSGILKIAFGERGVGSTIEAEIASFVTFREGRIAENQSYDCYAPA